MKIQYFYDIVCPYSWLGFQIIREKLPIWKTCSNIEIEYIPFAMPFVYTRSVSLNYSDKCVAEKNYRYNHLRKIVDHYGFENGKFERMYDTNMRTRATLLFLNVLRNEHPRLYPLFMDLFWRRVFVDEQNVNSVNDFLKLAREAGIQYSFISNIILKIEERKNVLNLESFTEQLMEEKIIGSPWIKFTSDNFNMSFIDIMRLELVDEIIRDPMIIPHSSRLDRISAL